MAKDDISPIALDREHAYELHNLSKRSPFDLWASPLVTGLNGSPWAITVYAIVTSWIRSKEHVDRADDIFRKLLTSWPTPEGIARADRFDVADVMEPLPNCYKRIRLVTSFSRSWLLSWSTMLDLPGVNQATLALLDEHARRQRPPFRGA